ncbi:MAG: T9SS type A sorting domain-containing protein, partial [Syntrophothermus sp.]
LKDLNSEKYEGSLVTVKGLSRKSWSAAWPALGSNANIKVFAGTDSTILFIDQDTDIDGTTEPAWPQDITGIATQYTSASTVYNDGYEIQPRSTADFKKTSGVASDLPAGVPAEYYIAQNYPNPFNPNTTIRYALPSESSVKIVIYNLVGQVVKEVVSGVQQAGYHETVFNANNLASGIYMYSITAHSTNGSKDFSSVKKMILMK